MSDYMILDLFSQGSSIHQLSIMYAHSNKISVKSAREVIEKIIYYSQLKQKVV